MLTAILVFALIAAFFGALLGYASIHFRIEEDPIVDRISNLLPQTQCGQCGYPGCKPYAEAIANEDAGINLCPPGGETTIVALADLLGRDPEPLSDSAAEIPALAVIKEAECIGCTLCIQACPVDAIVGAAKQMHTVIAQECTGCKLCLPPCPVDCIEMVPEAQDIESWNWPLPQAMRVEAVA